MNEFVTFPTDITFIDKCGNLFVTIPSKLVQLKARLVELPFNSADHKDLFDLRKCWTSASAFVTPASKFVRKRPFVNWKLLSQTILSHKPDAGGQWCNGIALSFAVQAARVWFPLSELSSCIMRMIFIPLRSKVVGKRWNWAQYLVWSGISTM